MVGGGGSRHKQTTPGSDQHERKEAIDTTNKLIREVSFDQHGGNYVVDLIDILRDYLNDPLKSDPALIKIVFTPVNEKQLKTYIDRYDVYLLGFRIGDGDALFEFGKYPTHVPPEPNEMPMTEKQMRKNRYARPNKNNTMKPADPVKEKKLQDSRLLGFDEGYGNGGITDPSDVLFGPGRLRVAIEAICACNLETITRDVCFNWRSQLTVITVMVCEAARFHPMCWFFVNLMNDGNDEHLFPWLRHIINSWSSMSKILLREKKSEAYAGIIPERFDDVTLEIVEELCKDEAWVRTVLAVVYGRK